MLTAVGIILALAFIGWLAWRAARRKAIKAYMVMYGLSSVAGIFTLVFFLSMDISKMIKILACIIFGSILIYLAARLQQRAKVDQDWKLATLYSSFFTSIATFSRGKGQFFSSCAAPRPLWGWADTWGQEILRYTDCLSITQPYLDRWGSWPDARADAWQSKSEAGCQFERLTL